VWPGGEVVLTAADGQVARGTAPFTATLPQGPVTVDVLRPGWRPHHEVLSLTAPTQHELWLEHEGQLLDRERIIQTCNQPKQVVFSPDGAELWVTCLAEPHFVAVHDARTGALLAQPGLTPTAAVEAVFRADGSRVYISSMESKLVTEVDPHTRAVTRTFERTGLWPKIVELSPDERHLYVAAWLADEITEYDLDSGALTRRLKTVHIPRGVYPTRDGERLYVAGFGNGQLDRVDLKSGQHRVLFSGGSNLRDIAADEAHGVLYISDMGKRAIWVHHLATGQTTLLARTDQNPNTIALSPDGQVLFVSCRGKNAPSGYLASAAEYGSILVLDTQDGAVLDAIVGGDQPTGLALSPDGTLLVSSDLRDHDLHVFRVPSTAELRAGGGGRRDTYSLRREDDGARPTP